MSNDLMKCFHKILEPYNGGTVAVSGGVDSMTLAAFAHNKFGSNGIQMVHAVSPAVPLAATTRLREHAAANNWSLTEINAGEFLDPFYRINPVNRCFYCKTNLYRTIRTLGDGAILAGTNCDDLDDYRPGLIAAKDYDVKHPYVEAGMNKDAVRALARNLGLNQFAQLPSSPCLSSRIQTGIKIEEDQLALVDKLETWLQSFIKAKTIRCRILREGLVIELDLETLNQLSKNEKKHLIRGVARQLPHSFSRTVRIESYERGRAFVNERPNEIE